MAFPESEPIDEILEQQQRQLSKLAVKVELISDWIHRQFGRSLKIRSSKQFK